MSFDKYTTVAIAADGIEPELEDLMYKILEKIKANGIENPSEFLLGLPGNHIENEKNDANGIIDKSLSLIVFVRNRALIIFIAICLTSFWYWIFTRIIGL